MFEKGKMIKSMETVIKNLNNKRFLYWWLMYGVADGDITEETTDEEAEEMYGEDLTDLMNLFARIMYSATKENLENYMKSTFYCDGVIS